jgi:hypothetical protein
VSSGEAERWRAFCPALVAIVVAGVAVRVAYTLLEAPWPPPRLDDQFYFNALPKLIAGGEGFVDPVQFTFRGKSLPTAEHPPLYSVVLAGLAELGGTSPDAQRRTGARVLLIRKPHRVPRHDDSVLCFAVHTGDAWLGLAALDRIDIDSANIVEVVRTVQASGRTQRLHHVLHDGTPVEGVAPLAGDQP